MKLPTKLLLLFASLLVMGLLSWWRRASSEARPDPTFSSANSPVTDLQEPVSNEQSARSQIVQPFARTPFLDSDDPRWIERRRLMKVDPEYQWKTPIEFFGRVLDENDQPVEGAIAELQWNGTIKKYGKDGTSKRQLTSDVEGLFQITGIEGKVMTVRVSKEGYHQNRPPNDGRFEYGGFWEPTFIEPDRNNPVVFRLTKRPIAEPTYQIGARMFVYPPELETQLDLLSSDPQVIETSDLLVRFIRPPDASYQKPFSWTLSIQGQNGAVLAETTDELMLSAPSEGYLPALIREFHNPTGNAEQNIRFYVHNPKRKFYASVEFQMLAYGHYRGTEAAKINIVATINPNDSRNVERERAMNIREMNRRR